MGYNYKQRYDPVPGIGRSHWTNFYNHMRHVQRRKKRMHHLQDRKELQLRFKIRRTYIPDPWDDYHRTIQRTWKEQSKKPKQYL